MEKYNVALSEIEACAARKIENGSQMDESMFRNIDHLNYRGADVYTRYLREQLLHPQGNL